MLLLLLYQSLINLGNKWKIFSARWRFHKPRKIPNFLSRIHFFEGFIELFNFHLKSFIKLKRWLLSHKKEQYRPNHTFTHPTINDYKGNNFYSVLWLLILIIKQDDGLRCKHFERSCTPRLHNPRSGQVKILVRKFVRDFYSYSIRKVSCYWIS